ncbi:E3 ubiquitin protein ligase UPL5-like protein [Tanacetum coccineum]
MEETAKQYIQLCRQIQVNFRTNEQQRRKREEESASTFIQFFRIEDLVQTAGECRVIALALMRKMQVGIVFARAFFLQLAEIDVSLEDIKDADSYLYGSCKRYWIWILV